MWKLRLSKVSYRVREAEGYFPFPGPYPEGACLLGEWNLGIPREHVF